MLAIYKTSGEAFQLCYPKIQKKYTSKYNL